ncbi:SprT family zinc-dependent metalloprotease [Accumulibacter sp.]|uniref:M48 family metallopeptidase n=1 Tax=Candidatus Accumulibacter proximus TaxID=2954385 RepID=A0A935PW25_9PROT|nr:SprT family zinc-dependent metalloprotease [Accumulibacter sp.]MBK7673609.1 M48 family metallopeptidase [Candidatus Accumulibacter proximus]MBL8374906.1 M48 family metallopeptidase [Accumulibacter sp.]
MPYLPEALVSGEQPLAAGETARTIELGERTVSYVLRRARRRTIGLTIDHRGLRVGAPPRATLREVESLIRQHGEWVGRKLDEWRARRQPEPLRIVDGVQLPMLGRPLTIRLALGGNRCVWNLQTSGQTLTLCLRSPAEASRLLEKALRERARNLFIERLADHAPRLGVDPPPLSLSAARTRWGSCSRRSGIRLNWRLIHFPLPVIDYVVVHELAHLHEMNHSPRFWAIVSGACPNHQALRVELQGLGKTLPSLV